MSVLSDIFDNNLSVLSVIECYKKRPRHNVTLSFISNSHVKVSGAKFYI